MIVNEIWVQLCLLIVAVIRYWSALTSVAKVVDEHRRSTLKGVHLVRI